MFKGCNVKKGLYRNGISLYRLNGPECFPGSSYQRFPNRRCDLCMADQLAALPALRTGSCCNAFTFFRESRQGHICFFAALFQKTWIGRFMNAERIE
jgi:hypothetical protein